MARMRESAGRANAKMREDARRMNGENERGQKEGEWRE
jgi:hypothetical protein